MKPDETIDIFDEITREARVLMYETEGHQKFDQAAKETIVSLMSTFAHFAIETFSLPYLIQSLEKKMKNENAERILDIVLREMCAYGEAWKLPTNAGRLTLEVQLERLKNWAQRAKEDPQIPEYNDGTLLLKGA